MGIRWRFELFGRLRALHSDRVLDHFQTQKTAVLLAFLAHSTRPHSREALIDMLWPDAELIAGRDRLTQALVWLRPRLEIAGFPRGSVLQTDRAHVGLNPENVITDVAEFEAALATARQAENVAARRDALSTALDLYRGDLLSDFYEDWVLLQRHRLQRVYLAALRQIVALLLEDGDMDRALHYAQRALGADPLQEEAHYDVIRVLAASRQSAAAFRQYEETKRLWKKEMDSLPSLELQAFVESIRPVVLSVPVLPATPLPASALPAPMTRFFGREAEIERIVHYLQAPEPRLVTLLGTGGSGKTRLALEAVRHFARDASCVVAFVPLADLSQSTLIPAAIADALRLPQSPLSAWERVLHALTRTPCVLILDNLEHLIPDVAACVSDLLRQVSTLRIVATSRQRLGVEGEQELTVPSLPLPDASATPEQLLRFDSVRLFVDRAHAVYPDFAVNAHNAAILADICARLEGIPLAIELCAAWARTLTPAQIQANLSHRFDLLVSHRRDSVARHRSLRAALDYSYAQLPPELRGVFAQLSVFRGGWSLEAATAICFPDAPDGMTALAAIDELRERSLVLAEEAGAEMRYAMLESLREFAADHLATAGNAQCHSAHANYFLRLAEESEQDMAGPVQDRALARLDRDQENLRAALAWTLETRQTTMGLRLGSALRWYWFTRGRLREGSEWLQRLLDVAASSTPISDLPPRVVASAWNALGHLSWSQADYASARHAHQEALRLRQEAGDDIGITESLYHLGITAYRLDDYTLAQTYLEESLTLAQARNDSASIARVLLNLGNIAYEQRRLEEARTLFARSLALERAVGNRLRIANALNNLGLIAMEDKDYVHAAAVFQEALTIHRELSDDYGISTVLANLGAAVRLLHQTERARALLAEGFKLAYELGNRHFLVHYLLQLGILSATESDCERSLLLLSAARHTMERNGGSTQISHVEGFEEALALNRSAMTEQRYQEIWADGGVRSLADVLAVALSPAHTPIRGLPERLSTKKHAHLEETP